MAASGAPGGRSEMSEYERRRAANVEKNNAFLATLGLTPLQGALLSSTTMSGAVNEQQEEDSPGVFAADAERRRSRWRSRSEVLRAYPGRCREIDALLALVTGGGAHLVVTGPPACGKSAVTRAVLEAVEEPFAWVSCATVDQRRVAPTIFERAAADLRRRSTVAQRHSAVASEAAAPPPEQHTTTTTTTPQGRTLDAPAFARFVEELAARERSMTSVAVVLDDAHVLFGGSGSSFFAERGDEANLEASRLAWAASLLAGAGITLRFVLVGDDRALCSASLPTGPLARFADPVRVSFDAYDADSLAAVLVAIARRRGRAHHDALLFDRFARQVVSLGRRAADPRHLAKLCASRRLFALYADGPPETAYARVKPVLAEAFPRLHDPYLDVDHLCARACSSSQQQQQQQQQPPPPEPQGLHVLSELPLDAALALLAAFVATYSHKDADRALFAPDKPGDRRRRRRRKKRGADDDDGGGGGDDRGGDAAENGPRPVPLDRLLSVHAHFLAAHTGRRRAPVRDPNLLKHLVRLTDLRLLERAATLDDLNHLKFKCLLSPDHAHHLALTLNFPLADYLPRAHGGRRRR